MARCQSENSYYLKDRLNMLFPILPDNVQTVTTLFNSKITSISYQDFDINFARIDILDEDISQINNIVETVQSGNRLEGKDYTNGNLNREI
ncbi:MAG: hypothetical protein HFJ36_05605 [Clostridia bacterium]|nr:hypothetical protein [Clostridia bacterium]